jgi:lysophospholipase L1-like esterase
LSDSSGQLDARYTTDGIHLNGQGYLQWLKAITPSVMDQNRQRKPG